MIQILKESTDIGLIGLNGVGASMSLVTNMHDKALNGFLYPNWVLMHTRSVPPGSALWEEARNITLENGSFPCDAISLDHVL